MVWLTLSSRVSSCEPPGWVGPFCVQFACSPCCCRTFLPQSKDVLFRFADESNVDAQVCVLSAMD